MVTHTLSNRYRSYSTGIDPLELRFSGQNSRTIGEGPSFPMTTGEEVTRRSLGPSASKFMTFLKDLQSSSVTTGYITREIFRDFGKLKIQQKTPVTLTRTHWSFKPYDQLKMDVNDATRALRVTSISVHQISNGQFFGVWPIYTPSNIALFQVS